MKRLLAAVLVVLMSGVPAFAQDALNLQSAQVVNSPGSVSTWPASVTISRVDVGTQGVHITHGGEAVWPNLDFNTNGPSTDGGGIQYTVWACVQPGGQWYCAAFIQMWKGRDWTGAAFLRNDDFANNWADPRFGPLHVSLHAGDLIALFVTQGNARFMNDAPHVRSNVVTIRVPDGDSGSFVFGAPVPPTPTPTPTPQPAPVPAPTPQPVPVPVVTTPTDLTPVLVAVNQLQTTLNQLVASEDSRWAQVKSKWDALAGTVGSLFIKYGLPALGAYIAGKKL